MKMTELEFAGAQPPIDAYAPTGFRIGGRFFEGARLLSAAGVGAWGAADTPVGLDAKAAEPLRALKGAIDVLLIGLGSDLTAVPDAFRAALAPMEEAAEGFGVEYMATPAACRTYNVLLSEERRVAAALLTIAEV